MDIEQLKKEFEQKDAPIAFDFWISVIRGVAKLLEHNGAPSAYVDEARSTVCLFKDVERSEDVDPKTGPTLDKYGVFALSMIDRGFDYAFSETAPKAVVDAYVAFLDAVRKNGPFRAKIREKISKATSELDRAREIIDGIGTEIESALDAIADADSALWDLYE